MFHNKSMRVIKELMSLLVTAKEKFFIWQNHLFPLLWLLILCPRFQCDFTVDVLSQILKLYHAVHLMKENGIYFGSQTDKSFHPLLTQNIKHGFETMKWCVGFYSDWLHISKWSIIYHFQQLGWCWMWKSVLCSHRSVQIF